MEIVERRAARVLLIANGAVLLIQGFDPASPELGPWWHTTGGGIEPDEPITTAAAREIEEETGLALDAAALGPCVARRRTTFEFDRVTYRQEEWFFAALVDDFEPHDAGWEDIERRSLLAYRWWTVAELEATTERVYPVELAALLRAVLEGGPGEPMVLSGD